MDFRILGPLEVWNDGALVRVASRRQRGLLVLLLINAGRIVPAERLIDQLWDGRPPAQAPVTLRSYISDLRHSLHSGAAPGSAALLVTRSQGYAVEVAPDCVDAHRLERLTAEGRAELLAGRADAALARFDAALELWRGEPLADLADHEAARSTIARLAELHLGAQEGRLEAMVAVGRHLDAVPRLEALVTEHPLREQPRAQLMLALHRAGRSAEALEVHRQFRIRLRDELGLDPGTSLDALMQAILRQSPELDPPTAMPLPSEPGTAEAPHAVATAGTPPAARPAGPPPSTRVDDLVGRHLETRTLQRCLERLVNGGRGGLLLVSGEPGIGKTSLLNQLQQLAKERHVAVHWGRAPSATGAPAFWPWTQVVNSVGASLDDAQLLRAAGGAAAPITQVAEGLVSRLGRHDQVSGDNPQTLRFLLYEAICSFLRQAGGGAALVVVLDDLHWADVPSLEMLSYIAPHLAGARILVAAAYRDVPREQTPELETTLATISREEAVDEIALRGLPHADVAALASQVTGEPASDALVTLLHERTGGNPFFVRQLAQLVIEAGPAGQEDNASTLPPGVRHVLASRLRAVAPGTLRLLECAAVVGRAFDLRLVAAAAGLDLEGALDSCDVAVRHGLVVTTDERLTTYRFIHALVQEVVYDQLPPGRAARLHARVATALEAAGAPVDQLAEQMWRGADLLPADKPLRYTLAAADRATQLLAYEQAEMYLRRAVQLLRSATPPDPQAELGVQLRLYQLIAAKRGWGAAGAREAVMRARQLAESGGLSADLKHMWYAVWMSLNSRNEFEMADEVALTLQRQADLDGDPVTAAVSHLLMSFRHFRRPNGRHEGTEELKLARAAADRAPREELAAFPEHLDMILLLTEAQIAGFRGDPQAHLLNDRAVALADEGGRPFSRAVARTLAATSSSFVPDAPRALAHANAALELTDYYHFEWLARLATNAHAWASAQLGADPAEQAARIRDSLELFRSTGHHASEPMACLLLADVLVLARDLDGARECLLRVQQQPGPHADFVLSRAEQQLVGIGASG